MFYLHFLNLHTLHEDVCTHANKKPTHKSDETGFKPEFWVWQKKKSLEFNMVNLASDDFQIVSKTEQLIYHKA